MTVRINLLPHREERRKRARTHFFVMAGVSAALGAAIVAAGWFVLQNQINDQEERNKIIKTEIAKLDKEIDEIKEVKDKIAALLARKAVIEALQTDRVQTVHLLDELVRQVPEGVFLRSLKQKGPGISLVGYAQSNARVSTLMRNIESSPWLANPQLVEITAVTLGKMRISQFSMNLSMKRPTAPANDAPKAAPKAAPAAKKG